MKRMKILICALLAGSLLIGGCKSRAYHDENVLYVLNWGEYIDPDVISMFEEETGIKVYLQESPSNEEMYPLVKMGAQKVDVICPSDYMIDKMIGEELLYELNYDNIPNIKNIDDAFLKTAQEFDPGNKYSVPYCWGTVGILYNVEMVDEPIDSWAAVFDEKYSKDILMIDSVRDAFMIALAYLGYNINSTNEAELNEAKELLIKQYPLVQAYVVDQVRDKMIGEEAAIGVIYSGEAIYTKRENEKLEYVVPKEGSNVWIDGWVISAKSDNKENAEKWIDFMLRGDIALMNFEYITYSTPNKVARDMIEDEDIKDSEVAFPNETILSRCQSFRYLGEDWDEIYMDKWNEVK